LPPAIAGQAYYATIQASGGVAPYTFFSEVLPAGLSATPLGADKLEISGTPTALAGTLPRTTTLSFALHDATATPLQQNRADTYPLTISLGAMEWEPLK